MSANSTTNLNANTTTNISSSTIVNNTNSSTITNQNSSDNASYIYFVEYNNTNKLQTDLTTVEESYSDDIISAVRLYNCTVRIIESNF